MGLSKLSDDRKELPTNPGHVLNLVVERQYDGQIHPEPIGKGTSAQVEA
jgi:hypothetical protein